MGGAYPANFVPKQAEYGARLEAILGTDGNVYTRVNPNGSFKFVNTIRIQPLAMPELRRCIIVLI